jgi:hypothetical protein
VKAFDAYFHAPFAAARAFLFSRVFLVLVALDAWTLMIGHAGRYGADGFNVAHFAWLDWLLPQPTAAGYIGVLIATGLLALTLAIGGTRRLALAALFLLYTISWAMSMLDSYQHHYFVSSVLLCLVFFPETGASQVHPPPTAAAEAPRSSATKPAKRPKRETEPATPRKAVPLYAGLAWLAIAAFAFIPSETSTFLKLILGVGFAAAVAGVYLARRTAEPVRVEGFGFNLLGATAGILYTYTSIAKLDAGWRDGHTITRISAAKRVYAPLVKLAQNFGIGEESFWSLFATSVIPIELTIAITYLVAVRADSTQARWPRRVALAGWILAMMLHVGAEAMELEIGWFSYYMMLFACAFLLPARVVDSLAMLLTLPASFVRTQLADLLASDPEKTGRGGTLAITAAVGVMLGLVGFQLDLPGAISASIAFAVVLAGAVVAISLREGPAAPRSLALGAGAAAVLMWVAIATSQARWDFYRFLGGDLKTRGEAAAALEAYERGERYAPKGQTRKSQIEALRKQLGR